tara:strand:- start:27500 stop:27694 length:195 start_codon:yes stop_codon:yes gene_type:complete
MDKPEYPVLCDGIHTVLIDGDLVWSGEACEIIKVAAGSEVECIFGPWLNDKAQAVFIYRITTKP